MTSKPKPTRERIVDTALHLFNAQGYGAVTTAMLAAECGIAEGNLWYHFKTRGALLDAISEKFAVAIERRLALRPGADPLEDYGRLLEVMMAEFRAFRFLYRDQQAYGDAATLIVTNAPRWLEMTFDQIESYLAELVGSNLLDWPRERLRDLAINATIILRYGLEHYRELGEPIEEGAGAVRRTLLRHLTLFEHRLDPAAAEKLHRAIEVIEAEALAA
jgi:AcrR family transcriptional regulator